MKQYYVVASIIAKGKTTHMVTQKYDTVADAETEKERLKNLVPKTTFKIMYKKV